MPLKITKKVNNKMDKGTNVLLTFTGFHDPYAIGLIGCAPVQRVKIIQHVRGKKWKAEWIDPNPGLVDYVESQNLLVPWKEQKAFFRDEEKARQLHADNEQHGYKEDSPMAHVLEWGNGVKSLSLTLEWGNGVKSLSLTLESCYHP